jgi:hypothetical protein
MAAVGGKLKVFLEDINGQSVDISDDVVDIKFVNNTHIDVVIDGDTVKQTYIFPIEECSLTGVFPNFITIEVEDGRFLIRSQDDLIGCGYEFHRTMAEQAREMVWKHLMEKVESEDWYPGFDQLAMIDRQEGEYIYRRSLWARKGSYLFIPKE